MVDRDDDGEKDRERALMLHRTEREVGITRERMYVEIINSSHYVG